MTIQQIAFSNNGIQLAGSLHSPERQPPHAALVVLHAAQGGTRDYPFYQHLIEHLPAQGVAVLLYDRRGSGRSSGDFDQSDFNDLAGDAIRAIDYLHSQYDIDARKIGVYGISQGGWIAPLVAAQRPDVAFLIIVSGSGVSPAKQMEYAAITALRKAGFSEDIVMRAVSLGQRVNQYYRGIVPYETVKTEINQVQAEPWFSYTFIGSSDQLPRDVTRDKWYYELDYDPLPAWRGVRQPTLFLFAEEDQWVPVPESISNFRRVTTHLQDVTLLKIDGTDHLMADLKVEGKDQISDRYVSVLISWLEHRIGLA